MEENIIISNLNDFIFCPRSIYFHNLYSTNDSSLYHTTVQQKGRLAHENIDEKKYSTKKTILQGIDIYSEELGVIGKIDLFDTEKKELIERKRKIIKLYEGYYLQLYAQYFCLKEMGYKVEKIGFYSLSDNKKFPVELPSEKEKEELLKILTQMRNFNLEDKHFSQNINKCKMCIYKELCDYYKDDE
ncbi:type V CRISPR-associated protein Cas4 [Candidatus Woesearchaeota archaeon]|nr:type V CRISPR-associated protein Cas4 [Nanoarchaeota archaeon]MCB9370309.1 type V CRISPR-associated protein Cas4 [Candidatus Woesearchaeota archaeon]